MKGNEIVLSAFPQGKFIEGIISGTPKPGTLMQLKASVEPVNGRHTYEAYAPGTGDGTPGEVLVLRNDDLQGFTVTTAYVSGTRGFLYSPTPGEELNVRKADISGTGSATEDLNIGEKLLVVDGTGKVSPVAVGVAYATGPVAYPFISMETITDQQEETLVWVKFRGQI